MKLYKVAIFATAVLAQNKKPNYAGSRPQNPNLYQGGSKPKRPKRPNQKPNYPTTTQPPVTKPNNYAAAGNDASNYGAQGAGYGDPHFMVSSEGQEPICFDYNPPAGSEMTLIMDPETGLHISAKVDGRRQGKTRFMTKVNLSSPLGAQLTIDERGVTLGGLPSWVDAVKERTADDGFTEYGDIRFTEFWSEDGSRDKITIHIEDGPSFLIKEKAHRETISFGITDITGISTKARGVIGQFVKPNAYTVEKKEEAKFATVHINDYPVEAMWDDFHRGAQCWTIEEDDLKSLFELSK